MANSSRNYKVIAPPIKAVLDARSRLDNTVQIGMPFVKATTTVDMGGLLDGYNGCIGFTLGVHAYAPDIAAQDIYAPTGGTWLGYTYTEDGKTRPVYTTTDTDLLFINEMFNSTGPRAGEQKKQTSVPPPGITGVTIGRNKNGLLASAQIKFSVPTLEQLEFLHRTFLIPGVGMVLEWGQQFALEKPLSQVNITDAGEYGLNPSNLGGMEGSTNIDGFLFPWLKRDRLKQYLDKLGNRTFGLEEILRNHVYPTQGQYMWMFGRVGNFHVNANSDGSYECSVRIVGPSEDAYAYTTRNTVIPRVDYVNQVKPPIAPCNAGQSSIDTYFSSVEKGLEGGTFLELLQKVNAEGYSDAWKGHVVKISDSILANVVKKVAAAGQNTEETFANYKDSYFVSWRFFVNVVLNGDLKGIGQQLSAPEVTDYPTAYHRLINAISEKDSRAINILRPYKNYEGTDISTKQYIRDPYEQPVGSNKFLRSADPRTMIIVNETAVNLFAENFENPDAVRTELNKDLSNVQQFLDRGDFHLSRFTGEKDDTGRLSTGVWINHKAIVECMVAGDTILRGVSLLLDRMNAATRGFWQLTIDVSEPEIQDDDAKIDARPLSYTVVDLNHRLNGETATAQFIDNVHTFNKYIRNKNGVLVGSDVLESNVTLDLPKRLFTQIATMGLVQQSDIDAVVTGEESGQPVILGNDANNTLARMFAITTISTKNNSGRSVDLSIPEATLIEAQCQKPQIDQAELEARMVVSNRSDWRGARTGAPAPINPEAQDAIDARNASNTLYKNGNINDGLSEQCLPCETVVNAELGVTSRAAPMTGTKDSEPTRPAGKSLWDADYKNGQLPDSLLKSVPGGKLYPDVADAYIRLRERINRELGISVSINSSYRDRAEEAVLIKKNRNSVKQPGSSPHGWGIALDLDRTVELQRWFDQNAPVNGGKTVEGFTQTYFPKPNDEGNIGYIHIEYVLPLENVPPVPQPLPPVQTSILDAPLGVTQETPPENPLDAAQQAARDAEQAALTAQCEKCIKSAKKLKLLSQQQESRALLNQSAATLREFKGLSKLHRYIETLPDLMVANIALSSDGDSSNAFGAAPGTLSIAADLVLPGINGLRVGELFWIDRIPLFYRAFGAFQILSIEDNISREGWTTRIHSRFNYLGKTWKNAMAARISGAVG